MNARFLALRSVYTPVFDYVWKIFIVDEGFFTVVYYTLK